MIALCGLGVSPEDNRFVKNGNTLLDNLLSFCAQGGGFKHTSDGAGANEMATEQAMLALTAACRLSSGQSGLFEIMRTAELSGSIWNGSCARRSLIVRYRADAPVWGDEG